jgi:hypothetical protein
VPEDFLVLFGVNHSTFLVNELIYFSDRTFKG